MLLDLLGPKSKQIYLEPKTCLRWFFFHIICIKPTLICRSCAKVSFIFDPTGQFLVQKVVPQATGESSKVKVKVRVNIHGIFSVSSASLVEVQKTDESEEPMETEQASEKDEQVRPNKSSFPLWKTGSTALLYLWLDVFVRQNKMQTDQDEQQNQGDSPNEPEEKPRENEEMEVRISALSVVCVVLGFDFWIQSWIFLDHRGRQRREKIWPATPSQKA